MIKKLRNMKRIAITMALAMAILISIPLSAQAATNVTFRTKDSSSSGPVYATWAFNAETTSNWVGIGYLQSGTYVSIAQAAVQSCGYYVGTIDGFYGANTSDGIKLFQTAYNLASDGFVGLNTWSKLNSLKGWYTTNTTLVLS